MAVIERHFLWALISSMVLSAAAYAAERPYYQGKNITFLINFSAGGPTDIEGRIVARHLARHIPGNTGIVVQNMSGGGGVTGINYLGEVAKHDGLTLGYFTGPYNHQMMKSTTLRVDDESAIYRFGSRRHGMLHSLGCGARNQETDGYRQS